MKALVVGMGASGLSMARYFIAQGYTVCAVDSRPAPPCEAAFAALSGVEWRRCGEQFSDWRAADFAAFERVGKSPGVSPRALAVAPSKIIGDVGLFAESWAQNPLPGKLLAVTGTNGKSTVVAMAVDLCRAAGLTAEAAGNIGEPLLDALARWREGGMPAVAVVELSSFQLETAASLPALSATVLNITPDHVDRHDSLAEYAQLKLRIYRAADYRAVNIDDTLTAAARADKDAANITFSQQTAADWRLHKNKIIGGGNQFSLAKLSPQAPPGNALAALALSAPLQLSAAACEKALANFAGLPHRRCVVGNYDDVLYVNDSKATNVEATCFALRQTAGEVVLIAGGLGKGQDFSALAAACGRVRLAILIGRDAPLLQQILSAHRVPTQVAPTMAAAVGMAAATAYSGDTVLLSPACASLDNYKDYAARGDDFAAACQRIYTTTESVHAAQ